jgi:hypothetical protein
VFVRLDCIAKDVKKNEYFIGRLENNDLSKLFDEVEAKSSI